MRHTWQGVLCSHWFSKLFIVRHFGNIKAHICRVSVQFKNLFILNYFFDIYKIISWNCVICYLQMDSAVGFFQVLLIVFYMVLPMDLTPTVNKVSHGWSCMELSFHTEFGSWNFLFSILDLFIVTFRILKRKFCSLWWMTMEFGTWYLFPL